MARKWMVMAAAALALSAGPALAQMQGHGTMEHGGMAMEGAKIPLGEVATEGVKARGMLKDIREAMAALKMDKTHHVMVIFTDEATGAKITEGLVAVKITDPAGRTGKAVKLMGMGDGFGADISLKNRGKYTIEVGTKLKDGNKRTFSYAYHVN